MNAERRLPLVFPARATEQRKHHDRRLPSRPTLHESQAGPEPAVIPPPSPTDPRFDATSCALSPCLPPMFMQRNMSSSLSDRPQKACRRLAFVAVH